MSYAVKSCIGFFFISSIKFFWRLIRSMGYLRLKYPLFYFPETHLGIRNKNDVFLFKCFYFLLHAIFDSLLYTLLTFSPILYLMFPIHKNFWICFFLYKFYNLILSFYMFYVISTKSFLGYHFVNNFLISIRNECMCWSVFWLKNFYFIKAMFYLSDPYLTITFSCPSYFHINRAIALKFWVTDKKALKNIYLLLNILKKFSGKIGTHPLHWVSSPGPLDCRWYTLLMIDIIDWND